MSIFTSAVANEQKRAEKEMQDKIKSVELLADEVLKLLASKDLDLNGAALVLKVANDLLNKKGSSMKLSAVI